MPTADFVLKQLRGKDAETFDDTIMRAADACELALAQGVIYARDHVNGAAANNGKH